MEKVKIGQIVITPYGEATIQYIDMISKAVKVKHTTAKTPVTDFYIKDLTPPNKITMKTKEQILYKFSITNHSGVEYVQPASCLQAMQEYANQQTTEMQKEIDELKWKCGTAVTEYMLLKQSADEMANSLKKYMIGTEIEFEVVAALENYKKLI